MKDIDVDLKAMTERHFPPAILEPWKRFAHQEAPDWTAHIFPMLDGDDQPVLYRLERAYKTNRDRVSATVDLVGEDQRALTASARGIGRQLGLDS